LDKLNETFATLLHLSTQLKFILNVNYLYAENHEYLNKVNILGHSENVSFPKAVSGTLQNYSVIIACSYIEEYNRYFIPGAQRVEGARIKKVRKALTPVFKRIDQWRDLKKYRNHILAHNFRIKGASIFSKNFNKATWIVPFSNSEHYLLCELLLVSVRVIFTEFEDFIPDIDFELSIADLIEFQGSEVDVNKEVEEIEGRCFRMLAI